MVERPCEVLGKYQFGDSIGHGAFGKVYRALNVETGDFIAIKQIEKAVIQPEHLPGILRECELLRTLNHPNIVTFIDSYETDEYLFYIMEYVEGGSVSKLVKKFGPFPESLLAHYISQVLKGLQYLHSQGVIHRDIKGENVLVTKQGTVKLVDFGSCTYQAMDKMLTVVGTPFWMAPEIIEMDGSARNTACDIWSLGCTIIELSTGFPPFWELGPMPAMFAMVNQEHPPLPPSISEGLRDFLLLCFTKEIPKRPTASQLLEHPWIAAALKKTEKIDFNMNGLANQENINLEATMKQLQMENENLRSTVKSLKQHMLKMMKDQKTMRAKIEGLEGELQVARRNANSPLVEGSPEPRRKTMGPGVVPQNSTSLNGTYLAVSSSMSPPSGANNSAERLFSPGGKPRAVSVTTKPLPIPPVNGNKYPPKLGTARLNVEGAQGLRSSNQTSPRTEEDQLNTRLRSSSEPIPSPFSDGGGGVDQASSPRGNQAIQTGSISSPRNSPVRNRCGTCAGCMEDGLCHYRMANLALSPSLPPPQQNTSPPVNRAEHLSNAARQPSYHYTHPVSPHTPHRNPTGTLNSYSAYAHQRGVYPQAISSTPNLPTVIVNDQVVIGGRVSPSATLSQPFSPSSAPATVFSPSASVPTFSPSSSLSLKPGDKCRVRSNSNTWHRAIVDELALHRMSAVVVYKATGRREEVLLENILTEEEGKRKKQEKEKGQNTGKRKHVATIFTNKP